ncbi:MAG TPA: nucleoside triphosphate pyrophosphatase [Polyangiales bacterium]
MQPRLVLASTSPYRSDLLRRIGLTFEARAPACDEEALKRAGEAPEAQAQRLALAKAESLAALAPDAFILGGDQLVELDGEVLGKPHTVERALAQLRRMRGKTHRLLTAFTLLCPGGERVTHLDTHRLTLRALRDDELERYVARDQPLDCAGSYKIEALGITLCERIEGEDFSAIMGLPLMALARLLRERGFQLP